MRCLTPRSSGTPTAGHQARSGGTRYIFASPGLASCRRRPLSSNVRPHVPATVQVVAQQTRPSAAPQPRDAVSPGDASCPRPMQRPSPSAPAAQLRRAAALFAAPRFARRSPCCVRRGGGYATAQAGSRDGVAWVARLWNTGARRAPSRVRPNPSLKRSANGRPPGPAWRYAVHFRQPGPGGLPSSSA